MRQMTVKRLKVNGRRSSRSGQPSWPSVWASTSSGQNRSHPRTSGRAASAVVDRFGIEGADARMKEHPVEGLMSSQIEAQWIPLLARVVLAREEVSCYAVGCPAGW